MQSGKTTPLVLKAKQGEETVADKWPWVEACVWTERMLAALDNGVKGGKWFSLIDKVYALKTLEAAWRKVRGNNGSAGVDDISIERFDADAEKYLTEVSEALKAGTYEPQPVKRVYIPKGKGKKRPLGIPVVKDRVIQTALKFVLEPIFENEFHRNSYGFRPGRGCKDALREVDRLLKEGFRYVVDADLKSYFDTIPHDRLLEHVETKVSDTRILDLLKGFLSQNIMENMETWTPVSGTPQGAVISPLLANIYLHPLDEMLNGSGIHMIRYADDFVILCREKHEAEKALQMVKEWVDATGLELHPDKTHIGDSRMPGEGFEFLGYRFESGRRWVRKSSIKALRNKVRQKTRRSCGKSIKEVTRSLNYTLRGWFEYFKHADKNTFPGLDSFVRRRMRSILRKQNKKDRGTGRCFEDHKRWPNKFFAGLGLFTMKEAWELACQSR